MFKYIWAIKNLFDWFVYVCVEKNTAYHVAMQYRIPQYKPFHGSIEQAIIIITPKQKTIINSYAGVVYSPSYYALWRLNLRRCNPITPGKQKRWAGMLRPFGLILSSPLASCIWAAFLCTSALRLLSYKAPPISSYLNWTLDSPTSLYLLASSISTAAVRAFQQPEPWGLTYRD